jgi:hypothetical protein
MTCNQQLKFAAMVGMTGLMLFAPLFAQQTHKPLTNLDVIKMVKGGLAESVVVSTIQSSPAKFDTSPDGLIALHKAGVTPGEMDAIMAASAKGPSSPSGNASVHEGGGPDQNSAMPPSKSRMPRVMVTQAGSTQELKLEKTQLAETKTKPSSMKSLAADSAVTQAMTAGISSATYSAATRMNSGVGGSTVQEAGSIFSGVMTHRKPTVTYVWGVPSPTSANVLQTVSPSFSIDFSRTPGVSAADYEPAIVRLTPAQNTCRIVGATEGKEDARSSPAADWQVYSKFLEERVAVKNEKLEAGKYRISPASELFPGEYAVVLRPVSKSKAFSGGDVARAQGDGFMFDAVWTFQIAESAE